MKSSNEKIPLPSTGKRISFTVFLLLAGFHFFVEGKEPVPSWLDTIPPKVEVRPRQRWHRSIFHVTLLSNERARLRIGVQNKKKMRDYRKPLTFTKDGRYRIYYSGEDDFGNRSKIDSVIYIIDTRPPEFTLIPGSGTYRRNRLIILKSNEPCIYYLAAHRNDSLNRTVGDSLVLTETIQGYFVAVDSAGNQKWSQKVLYDIDSSMFEIHVSPGGGIFNVPQMIRLTVPSGAEAYYTLDPLAPSEWFERYTEPIRMPHGLAIFRFFVKTPSGLQSAIHKESYILDTIAPKLHVEVGEGSVSDTVQILSKEKVTVRFTSDGTVPNESSSLYTVPLVVAREGISRIKAKAWDRAGNISDILTWEYKYDYDPPVVKVKPQGGSYREPVTVTMTVNEPAKVLYTLDGKEVGDGSLLYTEKGIIISRQGTTELRFRAVDRAENSSIEHHVKYIVDSEPPAIRSYIEGDIAKNEFRIHLRSGEKVTIYYTVNGSDPTGSSPVYRGPIMMKSGDVLRYFGADSLGNTTPVVTLDDLTRPIVEANPSAGLYSRRLRITFTKSYEGDVWWRLLPDTVFRQAQDTIVIDKEEMHTFEYFLESADGRSPIHRNVYFLDWTSPKVDVRVQKGTGDSAVLFFTADENASVYYTIDGSNPHYSATTRTACNKLQMSRDRIVAKRDPEARLAFYAEDAAGNQSALTILDVFKPRVIPNIPAGPERIHDRILSVNLQAQEGSVIHYARHGIKPTMRSPLFREAITLVASDTLVAFAIDASGYRGEPETFVYLIDLPPSPQFGVDSDTVFAHRTLTFDAEGTFDRESPLNSLKFSWDFNGDGEFDTDSGFLPRVSHVYRSPGIQNAALQVIDENGRKAVFRKEIKVHERCPQDMVASFDSKGKAFCIDRYEWPNRKGVAPLVNVSWVEAKMQCIDAGKRLCRADEWISACRNNAQSMYPYGDRYDPDRCVTENERVIKAGQKRNCFTAGTFDMVGNAWEWVEEKDRDYVQAYGGSYRYGKDAHCTLKFEGTVATRSSETGFRCCK